MHAEPGNDPRAFWRARAPRERRLLLLAAAVVLCGGLYGLVYRPLAEARADLQRQLPQLRAEARLLAIQGVEIERLRARVAAASATDEPLRSRVESAAAAHGLREAIAELASLDEQRLRVTTRPTPPSGWLDWLAVLEGQGIRVASSRLELVEDGLARAEAILTTAAP